jgi:hypothetical protein
LDSSLNISDNLSYSSKFLNSTFIPNNIKFKRKKKSYDDCSYDEQSCVTKNNNINVNNIYINAKNRINKNIIPMNETNVVSSMQKQLNDILCVLEQLKYISCEFMHDRNIKNYLNDISVLLRSRVASNVGNGATLLRFISVDGETHKYNISYKSNNIWVRNRLICEIDNIDIITKNKKSKIHFGNKKYDLHNNDINCFINDINRNICVLNNSIMYICSIKNM